MTINERAGKPADPAELVNPAKLTTAYYAHRPDAGDPAQQVAFGTSGHRGSAYRRSFNEAHIIATTQAICEHRVRQGIDGPLFLAKDTHALSEPAFVTAMEVLAGNAVEVRVDAADGYTPTPSLSHAILRHNRGRDRHRADGIVITPSHNPPEDGGFKYNPPSAGPADSDVTDAIQERANALLAADLAGVRRLPYDAARTADTTGSYDFLGSYVDDLPALVDLEAVRAAGVRLGADPLGGASVAYWQAIAQRYELDLDVVNERVDPTFRFMPLDWDGKIRMDCSSPFAMANLVALSDDYDIALGNDADADRHGIVAPGTGLMNPNHYLAVAIHYLFTARPDWPRDAAVGKTLVSSSMIDRVAAELGSAAALVDISYEGRGSSGRMSLCRRSSLRSSGVMSSRLPVVVT
jgi:phosphoglucomutase